MRPDNTEISIKPLVINLPLEMILRRKFYTILSDSQGISLHRLGI